MLKFSPSLQAQLAAATTKLAWCNTLSAALGNAAKLRIFHDTNSASADPATTGTEVLNAQLAGGCTISTSSITSFGLVGAETIRLDTNLTSGVSVIRIQNGSAWIQGTAGLASNGAYDFTLSANLSSTTGIGFASGLQVSAPIALASGTGPAAPDPDASMPAAIRVWDYSVDEAHPTVAGIGYMNTRDADIVFQAPELATNMGDVRVTRMADGGGVVLGAGSDGFRFAATVYSMNAAVNAEANVPLHQVRISAVPHGRWASFPFRRDFDITSDILAPKAFKIDILRADGTVLEVMEMFSTRVNNAPGTGKPINSSTQKMDFNVAPVQPFWTCHMTMGWQSHRPKDNTYASHFLPGVVQEAIHPSNVIHNDAAPEQWPIITGNFLQNGLGTWRMSPKWSRQLGTGYDTSTVDPYFLPPSDKPTITQLIGHGYEPGSTCHHTWYMGPGGSRHDRGCWPHALVAWITDKNGVRLHGAVPMEEMRHDWMMGYHNEGCHWFTNPEREQSLIKSQVLAGAYCNNDWFYAGGNENYRPDIQNTAIRMLAIPNGAHDDGFIDKYGRSFANEYARDILHNQSNAACGAYLSNSPMLALEAVHMFNGAMLAAFNYTQGFDEGSFCQRGHAWLNWQFSQMWMVGSSDPRSYTRAEVEGMWQRHLESVYDVVVVPYNAQSTFHARLYKQYGMTWQYMNAGLTYYNYNPAPQPNGYSLYDSKAFYWAQVLLFMKQSGTWAIMRAKSSKCAAALDLIVECLCRASIDFFVDSDGRPDKIGLSGFGIEIPNGQELTFALPANWGVICPPDGATDWITQSNGVITNNDYIEGYNTQHYRAQFVYMMRDFFSEIAYPRLSQAIAKLDHWYATVEAGRIAGTNPPWHWRFAMMGKFNAPSVVGPLTVPAYVN